MDRNFRSFLFVSMAMLLVFIGLQRMFLPDGPAPAGRDQVAKQPADKEQPAAQRNANEQKEDPADKASAPDRTNATDATTDDVNKDGSLSKSASGDQEPAASGTDSDKEPTTAAKADKPNNPERVVTLGSMDPAKGYRLLVTLTSRGAAAERVELVDEKKIDRFRFRAIEHRGGYVGYLGWRPADGGVLITTVPDGSPAGAAKSEDISGGLLPGDVLTSIDDLPVNSYNGIQRVLQDIKAGSLVKLAITRTVDDKPATLIFETVVSQPPLDVLRTQEYLSEQVAGNRERLSCLTTLATLDNQEIPLGTRSLAKLEGTLLDNWEVAPLEVAGGQGVEFRLPLAGYLRDSAVPADLVMIKRYRLLPLLKDNENSTAANAEAYTLDFETVVENHSDRAVDLSLRHEALAGITLEGWWYSVKVSPYFFKGAGQRDVRYGDGQGNHSIVLARSIYDRERTAPKDQGLFLDAGGSTAARSLRYVGLDAQYFAASFLPHPDAPDGLNQLKQAGTDAIAKVSEIDKAQAQATNTAFWFDTSERKLAPGESMSTRYRVFAGPKDTSILEHFGLERFIEYGWIPWIAKPLSWILYLFYSIVRNYGIAIIMLTLLVRGAMFPLGRQAAINGQKMQELQPEMKRINDLYKDDMPKRAEAMRELYNKHNFRPLASCLPMFLQLPIFMGLYRCLSVDISLRQEPLIPGVSWCSNLAGPDMLFDWSGWMPEIIAGRGTGYLGPYFNILPVVTVVLFLVQQKVLMPKATDEQTRMTQNMMQIMTVIMGVLFFKVPSGLCIYFITSSIWSLAERKLVKRFMPVTSTGVAAASGTASPASSKTSSTGSRKSKDSEEPRPPSRMAARLAELREMLDKPAVRSATQRRDPDKTRPADKNRGPGGNKKRKR